MTRHTDHADIVSEILTAELSAEADIVGSFEELLLEFDIAESMTILIALSWEIVIILDRSLLDSGEVGFSRRTTDDESDMIGRTSGSAESLHLLDKERHESFLIEDSLSLLIEISLICRSTTLSHEEELILIAFGGMDFDLRREVATGINLIIHIEGSILRIAEIILGISLINTLRDHLLIVAACPDLLTLIGGADRSAGILAEREDTLSGDFGITEHGESHILIIFGGFGIVKDLSHHLVMFAAEHKRTIVRGDISQQGESLRVYDEHFMAVPIFDFNEIFGDELILGGIRSEREHFLIMKRFISHNK